MWGCDGTIGYELKSTGDNVCLYLLCSTNLTIGFRGDNIKHIKEIFHVVAVKIQCICIYYTCQGYVYLNKFTLHSLSHLVIVTMATDAYRFLIENSLFIKHRLWLVSLYRTNL